MSQVLTKSEVANKIIVGLEAILRTKIDYKQTIVHPDYFIIDIMLPLGYIYNLSGMGRTLILEIRTLGNDPIGKIDVTVPMGKKLVFFVYLPNFWAEVFRWTIESREKEYYLIIDEEPGVTYVMLSDVPSEELA
jgi:hypothetical protein